MYKPINSTMHRSFSIFLAAVLLATLALGAAPSPRLQTAQAAPAFPDGQLKAAGALETASEPLFQAVDRLPANPSAGFWIPCGGVSHGGDLAAVNAIAISGSDIYLGGYFTSPGNNIIRWDTNTNISDPLGGGTSTGEFDVVSAIAVSGSDVYVGGRFASVGNGMANTGNIAKWNTTTKTWSPLGTGIDGFVDAIAISGSDVYVGGWFTSAGGVAASNIAKWNSSTNTWSVLGAGVVGGNGFVDAITISGTDVYVGGSFTSAGSVAASNIAKWNTSTSTWSALGAGTTGGTDSPDVKAIAISGDDVYVGGGFTSAGGVANTSGIAKWNSSTNTWSALETGVTGGLSNGVQAIAISGSGDDVYVGGDFTSAGGTAANNVAMWDSSTSTWSALGAGTAGAYGGGVRAIAIKGGDVYIGGKFQYAGGVYAGGLARWNDGTFVSRWSALGTGVNGGVNAIAINDSDVYVGGSFTSAGTCTSADGCNYIAKWNSSTNTWSALGTGTNNVVDAIAVSGSDVYAGGVFDSAGTCTHADRCVYIAKWNSITNTWSPLGTGPWSLGGGFVYAIAVNGSDLYVGGAFTEAGTCTSGCSYIAKWDTLTNTWSALGTGLNSTVRAIAVSGSGAESTSDVYVGGNFTQAGTCTTGCNNIARWNSSTNTWSALGTGANNPVNAIAISGSDMYAGGNFTSAGTCTSGCRYIARWDISTDTWSALGIGTNGYVYALAANGSDVYVGGYFPNAFSMAVSNIVKFNTSTGTASALEGGTNNTVSALAITPSGSDVYAGGSFSKAGLVCTSADGCNRIAKWDASGPSSNANLSDLVLSSGTLTPAFASVTTAYTATVLVSVTNITLTPTAAEAHATITVNGATVASGNPSGAIALNLGENPLTIVVTAQDGTTTRTYTVTVTRGAPLSKIYLPLAVR